MKKALILFGVIVALLVALVLIRGIPADTEYEIFRDPVQGTVFRMSQVEVAARRAWRDSGQPPESMAALLAAVPNVSGYEIDRWSRGMVLTVQEPFLVLVSPGRDGIVGSEDDLVQVSTQDSTWLGLGSVEEALKNPIAPPTARPTVPH